MVTWLKFEKSTNYYHDLHLVEDLGMMFSSPRQEYLVSVKNVDQHETKFVEVCTN